MGTFEYILLALVLLTLIALVVLIVLVLKKKDVSFEQKVDLEMHDKMTTPGKKSKNSIKRLRIKSSSPSRKMLKKKSQVTPNIIRPWVKKLLKNLLN